MLKCGWVDWNCMLRLTWNEMRYLLKSEGLGSHRTIASHYQLVGNLFQISRCHLILDGQYLLWTLLLMNIAYLVTWYRHMNLVRLGVISLQFMHVCAPRPSIILDLSWYSCRPNPDDSFPPLSFMIERLIDRKDYECISISKFIIFGQISLNWTVFMVLLPSSSVHQQLKFSCLLQNCWPCTSSSDLVGIFLGSGSLPICSLGYTATWL